MLLDDERAVESIARAMQEFDNSTSEKTWKDLARVAYLATIRHIAYEKIHKEMMVGALRVQ
jgi:hypothetical protein